MGNNWFRQFLDGSNKKISPAILFFVILQVIFITVASTTIIGLNNNEIIEDDATHYKNLPELVIDDLVNEISFLSEDEVADIQKRLFEIVSENTTSLDIGKVDAVIRENKIYLPDFNEDVTYFSTIVDIPSLEQSYQIFYGSNLDPDVATFVLCLENDGDIIYKDFKCKSSDSILTRNEIVSYYLKYYDFGDLMPIVENNLKEITLLLPKGASIQENGNYYIEQVKEGIKLLGISPEIFKYSLREYDDINYDEW